VKLGQHLPNWHTLKTAAGPSPAGTEAAMPIDRDAVDEDELEASEGEERKNRRFTDFDCPTCSANNPYDDSFGDGDQVLCYYCGQDFEVHVSDEGRLRLKEA
jgi:hypothetical protein